MAERDTDGAGEALPHVGVPAQPRPRVSAPPRPRVSAQPRLVVPAQPAWALARPRLGEVLEKGACGPLTLVTGPPGAGKTLALTTWLRARRPDDPVAWVGLDADDAVPGTFWGHVDTALRGAGVRPGRRPDTPRDVGTRWWPPVDDGPEYAALGRLADTVEQRSQPVLLVLDGFEYARDPRVTERLAFLLRHAPTGLRLVVASRVDPLLPLARYRLAGDLTELRAADLAFTTGEAGRLLAQHGVTLAPDALRVLLARTEGWAAGLRLAALALAEHPDPAGWVATFASDATVTAPYLVAEVLDRQPPDVRHLLLTSSIVDLVHEDLADALAGVGAGGLLPGLVRQHAFVETRGDGWYRYHPLLADVLRARLRHESPGLDDALHRRAARWFRRAGMPDEAARQWAAAGRAVDASRVVVDEMGVTDVLVAPDGGPLAPVLRGLGPEVTDTAPEAALVRAAVALADGDPPAARRLLTGVDVGVGGETAPEAAAASWALVRLAAARASSDEDEAAAALDAVTAAVDVRDPDVARGDPASRALLLLGYGAVALAAGRAEAAGPTLTAGLDLATAEDLPDVRLDCLGHLALGESLRGRSGRAASLVAALAGDAPDPERPLPASVHVATAACHLDACRDGQAVRHLDAAAAATRRHPQPFLDALRHMLAARAHTAAGRPGRALDALRRGREAYRARWLARLLAVEEAEVRLAAGETGAVREAVERAGGAAAVPAAAVVLARVHLARRDGAAAAELLDPLAARPSVLPPAVRVPLLLLSARLALASGETARGQGLLGGALRVADAEHLRRPCAAEAYWLRAALAQTPDLVRRHGTFLAPAGLVPRDAPPVPLPLVPSPRPPAYEPASPPTEPLSPRERDTLVLLARMLTTEEIADEMFLSVNTVKTHLKSIYRKLGVSSRRQAVRVGEELDLV